MHDKQNYDAMVKTIKTLLDHKVRIDNQLVDINFKIGQIVYDAVAANGESEVARIAFDFQNAKKPLSEKIPINEDYLFETMRVYRGLRSPRLLSFIRQRLNRHKFTWSYLAYQCIMAPTGNSEEAKRFWEREIFRAESTVARLETIQQSKQCPEEVKDQIEGFLSVKEQQSTANLNQDLPGISAVEPHNKRSTGKLKKQIEEINIVSKHPAF